jgi:hypothetical protein
MERVIQLARSPEVPLGNDLTEVAVAGSRGRFLVNSCAGRQSGRPRLVLIEAVIATTTMASMAVTAIVGPDHHSFPGGAGPIGTMIRALCQQIGRSTLMGAGCPRDALELAYDVQVFDRHPHLDPSGLMINRRLARQSMGLFGPLRMATHMWASTSRLHAESAPSLERTESDGRCPLQFQA